MKVLVIGSGGREHALVWKIAQSKKVTKIFCAPGNPGTEGVKLAHLRGVKNRGVKNVPIGVLELGKLADFAKGEQIDLTIVGPEAPLIAGIADLFKKNNLPIIGPSKKAAQIEGSKVFAKKLMLKYGIPTAKFAVFDDYIYAKEFLKTQKYPLVIKAEGQCLGKGVKVCQTEKEAQAFLKEIMVKKVFGNEGKRLIIEECLIGQEVSFMVATDGKDFVSLLPSQDHKRVLDGDHGPNTGGMGAYAPVPFVDKKLFKRIEREIVAPTIKAMTSENIPYQGILYPGLILTKDGPKVLEFNCRFGDPETQPVLPLLQYDIIDLFEAIIRKKVGSLKLKWYRGASVCVVLASRGYPGEYEKGKIITFKKDIFTDRDINIFHSGTKIADGRLVTNGGRVLGITARDKNLKKAIKSVYKYIGKDVIHFSGMQYRKDIGRKGLNKK